MTVERIFTRTTSGAGSTEHTSVQVIVGAGIEGDRYFGRHEEPGQNVTFIEAEEIEAFFAEQGSPLRSLSIWAKRGHSGGAAQ